MLERSAGHHEVDRTIVAPHAVKGADQSLDILVRLVVADEQEVAAIGRRLIRNRIDAVRRDEDFPGVATGR